MDRIPFVKYRTHHPTNPHEHPRQNPSRYLLYGDVSARAAQMLRDPEVEHFFTRLIQRVAPKSYVQGACGSVVAFLGGGFQ